MFQRKTRQLDLCLFVFSPSELQYPVFQVKAKRWDFDMDIAAPKVILPESFTDSSKTLVVLDLGRFQFCNSSAQITDIIQREISEEDGKLTTLTSCVPILLHHTSLKLLYFIHKRFFTDS